MKEIILVLMSIALCATGASQSKPSDTTKYLLEELSGKEIVIPMDEGSFTLKNISIEKNSHDQKIKGSVTNNTPHKWTSLVIALVIYDKSGNKIKALLGGDQSIILNFIDKNETQPVNSELYLENKSDVIQSLAFSFKEGYYLPEYKFTMLSPKPSNALVHEDLSMKISFDISKDGVSFMLQNKTSNTIEIDWNKLSYIDSESSAHRVMHSGVRYMERDKPQAPTVIPPMAKVEDVIIPTDSVHYNSGWVSSPILPLGPQAKKYVGKTISIFMPLMIGRISKQYTFRFKIIGA